MTELIPITPPPINFLGSSASSLAAKRVLRLEEFPALTGFTGLPTGEVKLRRFQMWNQVLGNPASNCGDVGFGIDPGGGFIADSGFPAMEKCWPERTKTLGILEFGPGFKRLNEVFFPGDCPIIYRPGVDLIFVAPEVDGYPGLPFQVFVTFWYEGTGDLVLDPNTVFRSQHMVNTANNPGFCIRGLIPNLPKGGTEFRVHDSAWESGISPTTVSVGVQASGPNMVATPVPVTYNGGTQPKLSRGPWRTGWSDWRPLVTTAGQSLIVNMDVLSAGSTNNWAFRTDSANPSWYAAGVSSCASAAMLGSVVPDLTRNHIVDCVQAR